MSCRFIHIVEKNLCVHSRFVCEAEVQLHKREELSDIVQKNIYSGQSLLPVYQVVFSFSLSQHHNRLQAVVFLCAVVGLLIQVVQKRFYLQFAPSVSTLVGGYVEYTFNVAYRFGFQYNVLFIC